MKILVFLSLCSLSNSFTARYGKENVCLLPDECVSVEIALDTIDEYVHGDNRHVIPTDSLKNIIFSTTPEMSKIEKINHVQMFVQSLPISFYKITVRSENEMIEKMNNEMTVHSFFTTLFKPGNSSFESFSRSSNWTTLIDEHDRPLYLKLELSWLYSRNVTLLNVTEAVNQEFEKWSTSVQQLMYRLYKRLNLIKITAKNLHTRRLPSGLIIPLNREYGKFTIVKDELYT